MGEDDVDIAAFAAAFVRLSQDVHPLAPARGASTLARAIGSHLGVDPAPLPVVFVLTTNRVELLEPALAARPGRIDQAVEIRLPDPACRRRLLDRYLQGMTTDVGDVDDVIERTEGVSAAFLKELGRRAALVAAEASEPTEPLIVRHRDLVAALDDLLEHSTPILRSTLGASPDQAGAFFGAPPAMMMMRGFHAMPSPGMHAAMFDEEIIDYTEE